MPRPALFIAALLAAAPAAAGSYSATTAAPADGRIVARDIAWSCAGTACRGKTAESRPMVICQGLAKRAGRLAAFTVDGRAFAPAELDKCNAFAPRAESIQAAQN